MEDDGYSSISGETLQRAMQELNENPATRGIVVKELRERIVARERELKVIANWLAVPMFTNQKM